MFLSVIISGEEWMSGCDKPLHVWNIVAILLYLINFSFGIYVYRTAEFAEGKSTYDRAVQFFLYDVGVALYIVVAIFIIVWAVFGLDWASQSDRGNAEETCSNLLIDLTRNSSYFLVLYLCGGLGLILFSLAAQALEYCIEDANPLKIACCCFYYLFCYEGPPEGWQSQYERRQSAQNANRDQVVAFNQERQPPPQQVFSPIENAFIGQPQQQNFPPPQQAALGSVYVEPPPAYAQSPATVFVQKSPMPMAQPGQVVFSQPVEPAPNAFVGVGQPAAKEPSEPIQITSEDLKKGAAVAGDLAKGLGKLAWKAGSAMAKAGVAAAKDAKEAYDADQARKEQEQYQ